MKDKTLEMKKTELKSNELENISGGSLSGSYGILPRRRYPDTPKEPEEGGASGTW